MPKTHVLTSHADSRVNVMILLIGRLSMQPLIFGLDPVPNTLCDLSVITTWFALVSAMFPIDTSQHLFLHSVQLALLE